MLAVSAFDLEARSLREAGQPLSTAYSENGPYRYANVTILEPPANALSIKRDERHELMSAPLERI